MEISHGQSTPILRSHPIYLQVYDYLRRAIASGELHAGDRLVEVQIASSLGISRAPVREAIRKLEQDGLVQSVTGKGSVVTRPTLHDIRDVYSCRAALEGLAVTLSAASPDPDLLARLTDIVERKAVAVRARDVEAIFVLNNEFHDMLLSGTGNRLLGQLTSGLGDRILFYRKLAIKEVPYTCEISQVAHREIVEAIRNGEAERAREIAFRNVFEVYEVLAAYLRANGLADTDASNGPQV